jgi:hypothetical protein
VRLSFVCNVMTTCAVLPRCVSTSVTVIAAATVSTLAMTISSISRITVGSGASQTVCPVPVVLTLVNFACTGMVLRIFGARSKK